MKNSFSRGVQASRFQRHQLGAAVLASLAASAFAQQGTVPAAPGKSLPPVTVTAPLSAGPRPSSLATGVAGSSFDTPFSVTTVPGELLREQAGTTLQDALRNVPGAQADSGFNGSHTQFFVLRGAVTDNGTGSNRVLRDGARLSNYPYVPAFIDSVDVLRGAGAAVGVRSEPGGTVNLVTKQPQMRNFGSVLLGAGKDSAQEISVDLNRVVSQDNEVAARIIATRSNSSEWRQVPDRLDGLKIGLAKSDGNRYHLRAGVEVTHQVYRPDFGIPSLNGSPIDVPRDRQLGEPFGDSTTNNRIFDLHADVALSSNTTLSADFTRLDASSTSIKNSLNGNPLAGQPAGTFARASGWEPGTDRRIDSLSTALTTVQNFGGLKHQLFFGLDYYKETLNQPTLLVPAANSPPINVFNPVFGRVTAPVNPVAGGLTTQDLDAMAFSAQDQIDVGDWSVVAGARYDQQNFRYGAVTVLPVDESRWSPKLAVLRRVGEADTVYANVSTGTAPNQVASATNRSLPSRRSRQAELGWKSLWQGGKLTSDIAVYRLDLTNMISSQGIVANAFAFDVSGAARSQGLEASLTGNVTDNLNVALSYAYTHARYLQNAVYGNKVVPNVARNTLNAWATYRWNAEWKTGLGIYSQSQRFADEANTTVLPAYSKVDVTQTWSRKLGGNQSVELQLALRNVFDKAYFVSSHLHVARWVTPGQGRNASLTATYRF